MTVSRIENHWGLSRTISQISLQAVDLDEMLAAVLEEVLSALHCDRAWLLFPCDPDAPSWRVPMECARPEWPGAFAIGEEIPMDQQVAEAMRGALKAGGAVVFDAASETPVPESSRDQFGVKSMMAMAIRPKVGKPWVFGIHHCASDHNFTPAEVGLFEEIGLRLAEALSNLLMVRKLQESGRYNRMLFESSPIGLVLCRMDGSLVDINQAYADILGRTIEETKDLSFWEITPEEYADQEREQLEQLNSKGRYGPYLKEYLHKDGHRVPVRLNGLIIEKDGEPHIWSCVEDITDSVQAEALHQVRSELEQRVQERTAALRAVIGEREQAEAKLHKLYIAVEQSVDGVVITDMEGCVEYVNAAIEKMTGYTQQELLGKKLGILKSGKQSTVFYRNLWDTLSRGEVFESTFVNRRKNGEFYHQEETISPVRDEQGRITNFVAICKDVSQEVETQERLEHLAYHDQLTGLPNRTLLRDRLEQAIRKADRDRLLVPVIFIDLDNFKDVNDTLGHSVGDRLLKQVAARMGALVRAGDTVARFGGDEFVVLLEGVDSLDGIARRAAIFLEAFDQSFMVDERDLRVTASMGVAIYPTDAGTVDDLFRAADTAMYRAKEGGRNAYKFFTTEMAQKVMHRVTLERSLRTAIEDGEFLLHYQPRLVLSGGQRLTFVEALIRWQPKESGLIYPGDFVPVLEDTGLIVQAGEWVLCQACAQLQQWRDQGHELGMAVNVSPRQFWQKGLPEVVERCLRDYDLNPEWLELEITEGVVVEHSERITNTFTRLEGLGVRIAIDDFGTGFSSMSYLKRLPIHTLKIDRSFVEGVTHNPDDAAITNAIISLAHSLRLAVTAEGVETEDQLEFLKQAGCHEAQGYLLARPMTVEAMEAWLQDAVTE